MGKKHFVFILLFFLVIFTLLAAVSAQDVDIDSMDREQLLMLIQLIQSKLLNDEPADVPDAEATPEPKGPVIPAATPTPELKIFSIYENKKLMIEALPEYMFIPKDSGDPDEDKGPGITTTPVPDCPDGCVWFCPPQPSVLACGCWC